MLRQGMVSPTNSHKLRWSVAVFVCLAFVLASSLALSLIYCALVKPPVRLDIGIEGTWFLRRGDWQAMPESTKDFLDLPVKYILVGHSAGAYCKQKYDCIKNVLDIQKDHMRRGWDDIGPNYLISGEGLVFEGRGANVQSAMVKSYNRKCVSIMFLGHYSKNPASKQQWDHLRILLDQLLELGVLVPNYVIYGHCQVSPFVVSPGTHVIEGLRNFTHWDPTNADDCFAN